MLKKSLATIVALTLIFALAPALPVWAAVGDVTGVIDKAVANVSPFILTTAQQSSISIAPTGTRDINLQLNYLAIQENGTGAFTGPIPDGQSGNLNNTNTVGVSITGTGANLFASPSQFVEIGSNSGYNLVLKPVAADAFNHPFDLTIMLTSTGATSNTVNIKGNIEPFDIAIKTITGSYTGTSNTLTLPQGSGGTLTIAPYFSHTTYGNSTSTQITLTNLLGGGTTSPITGTYAKAVWSTSDSFLSFSRNGDSFVVTVSSGATVGTHSGTISIEAVDTATTTCTYTSIPVTVIVEAAGEIDRNATSANRITLSSPSSIPASTAIGTPFTFRVPTAIFTNVNAVSSNVKAVLINTSGQEVSGLSFSVLTVSGGYATFTMTANSAVTVPANLRIALKDSTNFVSTATAYTLSSALQFVSNVPITGNTITGIDGGFTSSSNYYITTSGNKTLNVDISDILEDDEIYPGDEVYIHFNPSFFSWSSGTPTSGVVTRALLNSGNITFKTGSLSTYIESASLKTISNNEQVISVKFKAPLVSTKAVSIKDSPIYIMHNKSTSSPSTDACRLYIGGYIMNKEQDVSNDSYASFDGAPVIVADGALSNIELDLGNGVLLTAKRINSGAKVYGYTTAGPQDSEDDSFFSKYNLDDMVELYTIGLNNASNTVQLDMNENYYVYAKSSDSTLAYLGRSNSNKKLPYYQKYYLSIKELSVPAAGGSGTENIDETTSGSSSGAGGGDGGGSQTNNGNYNPNTGR